MSNLWQKSMRLAGYPIVKGIVLSLLVVIGFQNCSDVKLQRVSVNSAKVTSHLCLQPPETKKRYSKVAFMVDKSGSNGNTDLAKSSVFLNTINVEIVL